MLRDVSTLQTLSDADCTPTAPSRAAQRRGHKRGADVWDILKDDSHTELNLRQMLKDCTRRLNDGGMALDAEEGGLGRPVSP